MTLANESPVYIIATKASDDVDMQKAIAQARKTFGYFWREMTWESRRIVKGLDASMVKVGFSDPGDERVEYMWLVDVDFDGATVFGTLTNEPNFLTSVTAGEMVEVPKDQIADWAYSREGHLYGGFTIDVIRQRMDEGELRSHDNAWGFGFGNPGNVALIPSSKAQNSTTKPDGAIDHPMGGHMADALDGQLSGDSSIDVNEIRNGHGLSLLHQMVAAGSGSVVEVLLKHGADTQDLTPSGLNAAQLAQSLGWTHLVRLLQR